MMRLKCLTFDCFLVLLPEPTQYLRQSGYVLPACSSVHLSVRLEQDNSKSCRRNLMMFLDGWDERLATADYIFIVIRITMYIQKFFKGIFLTIADRSDSKNFADNSRCCRVSTNCYEFLKCGMFD